MKGNKAYRVLQLDTNFWAIEDACTSENSIVYVLRGEAKALVFDTGPGLDPILPIIKKITDLPLVVCLSHWHFDHTGGAHEFDQLIAWGSVQMRTASARGITADVIESQVGQDFWESVGSDSYSIQKFPRVRLLNNECELDIGGYNVKVLHTPGHTMDSICLYESNKGWLFSGDTLYPGPIYLQFQDSDARQYMQTLQKLEKYKVSSVFPGHNAPQTSGEILSETKRACSDDQYISNIYPNLRILHKR